MKKKSTLIAVGATLLLGLFAAPASAGGQVCYSVSATVNGETVVNEASCVPIG